MITFIVSTLAFWLGWLVVEFIVLAIYNVVKMSGEQK